MAPNVSDTVATVLPLFNIGKLNCSPGIPVIVPEIVTVKLPTASAYAVYGVGKVITALGKSFTLTVVVITPISSNEAFTTPSVVDTVATVIICVVWVLVFVPVNVNVALQSTELLDVAVPDNVPDLIVITLVVPPTF